jgi:diguanylate cyclase (GGDEF)-like protein
VQQTEKLEKAQEELKLLASIDPMTKLFNRRYFMDMSKSILDLAKRNKTDTAIIMIDIDKFKNINDTYGHQVGDDVIIELSSKLQDIGRKSDIVSRWGGEEFLILLPNTNTKGSLIIAEKIRKNIEEIVINLQDEKKLQFTVSVGVSQFHNKSNDNIESSINRADEALYKAKASGRNKVCSKLF